MSDITLKLTLTPRAEAFLDAIEVAHNARRAEEQAIVEKEKKDRLAAAERGETFHGHPHLVIGRGETPAMTREEIAAKVFERGAESVLNLLTRAPHEHAPGVYATYPYEGGLGLV